MSRTVVLLIVLLVSRTVASAQGAAAPQRGGREPIPSRIYKLEELRAPQIEALDRERTLFILPVGMLEVHGPHLPIGTDILGVIYEANAASKRLSAALTNWNIVMMPPISYGQGGANELGGRPIHPGTYGIRQSTLRSLVADLGGQVAQNGFKWIFVLNGHGAPTHNLAINDACDFVSETFHVTMLHVTGLLRADPSIQAAGQKVNSKYFSASQLSALGLDVHGGVGETSGTLAIRPDLVSPQYRKLPSRVGRSLEELLEIAAAPGWEGYLSDPAKASAAHGRAVEAWWIAGFAELILRAVGGENMFRHPRFPEAIPAPAVGVTEKALANEAAFEATLETWLQQRQRR
jgi:creatinine amidohydrolase